MGGFDIDRRTVMLLVGVLVAAVGATVFLTRGGGQAQPVAAPVVSVAPAVAPSESPSASAAAELVVEVVGRVRHPQVVTLPKGARVMDALAAAGGAKPGVDTSDQNLARLLVDGEQIRIGLDPVAASVPSAPGGAAGTPVDINTASAEQLEQIPGVGPVLAQRILAYRQQNGGFTSVEQLTEVSGIGDATFAQMQPMVTVGSGG